jgi:hypothetical protein
MADPLRVNNQEYGASATMAMPINIPHICKTRLRSSGLASIHKTRIVKNHAASAVHKKKYE